MTHQEAYDTICEGLAKQKRRCVDGTGNCKYRGLDGMKCAVGMLIPDHKYDSVMEHEDDGLEEVLALAGLPMNLHTLLSRCQSVHDSGKQDAESLRGGLLTAAKLSGVTPGAEEAITEWTT